VFARKHMKDTTMNDLPLSTPEAAHALSSTYGKVIRLVITKRIPTPRRFAGQYAWTANDLAAARIALAGVKRGRPKKQQRELVA
jgi:hypothetical protein